MSETRWFKAGEAWVYGFPKGQKVPDELPEEWEPVAVLPLAELAALRRGPWVPCAERTPTDLDRYIVTVRHERDDQSFTDVLVWGGTRWDADPGWVVLAWMPLPEPGGGAR